MKAVLSVVVISLLCFIVLSNASKQEQLFKLAHNCFSSSCDEVTILQLNNLLEYYEQSEDASESTVRFARKVIGGSQQSKSSRGVYGTTVNLTCETIVNDARDTFTCEVSVSAPNGVYAVGFYPLNAQCIGECTLFYATNSNITIHQITFTARFQVISFFENVSVNAAVVDDSTYNYVIADRVNVYSFIPTLAPTPAPTFPPAAYQLRIGTYFAPTQVNLSSTYALQLTTSMTIYSTYGISYAFVSYLDQRGNSFHGDVHPYTGFIHFEISFSAQNVTPGVYCPIVLLMDTYSSYNTTYLRQCINVTRPSPTPTSAPTTFPPTTFPTQSTTRYPTQVPTNNPPTNYPIPTGTPVPPTRTPSTTNYPTQGPTNNPPTNYPTGTPTSSTTNYPTQGPTNNPTNYPTGTPTSGTTNYPTQVPTNNPPTNYPTGTPTSGTTNYPTQGPTNNPPTNYPTGTPTSGTTNYPTQVPINNPTNYPTGTPTSGTTNYPTGIPTSGTTNYPTQGPTNNPPTNYPTRTPTSSTTNYPTQGPTNNPPTNYPTGTPTSGTTNYPTPAPTANPSSTTGAPSTPSPTTNLPEGTTRLVPGPAAGRLEIVHSGVWGTVCDDSFDDKAAVVACRKLGYANGTAEYNKGNGSGQIWLDEVRCNGTETDIVNCLHNSWGYHDCQHYEDVSLNCRF